MNLRDPKTQISAVVVVVFLCLFYIWFAKIYSPFQTQIQAKEVRKGELFRQLHEVEEKAKTLSELEKDYNKLLMEYKKVELLLPEKKEDEAFLSQVHAAAQLTNSIVRDITPLGTIFTEFYEINNYNIEVESSYHGLGRFLAKVANFPFIVNLEDISLKSPVQTLAMLSSENIKRGKPVIATFKISTYNVKQGQGS